MPKDEKPKTIPEYTKWLASTLNVTVDQRTATHYESVVNKAQPDLTSSSFWSEVCGNLAVFEQDYLVKTGYPLFLSLTPPELVKKPFESLLQKTYRKNVVENAKWPSAPKGGWITPQNWVQRTGDLVRTTVVVKYLDGIDYLVEKLTETAERLGLKASVSFEARDEGYYAAHFYTFHSLHIPTMEWDTVEASFAFEIQITTQLQEVIRRLLHSYYEERRIREVDRSRKWQWNYRSEEFGANYLGHILHYLEGVIIEIRERKST